MEMSFLSKGTTTNELLRTRTIANKISMHQNTRISTNEDLTTRTMTNEDLTTRTMWLLNTRITTNQDLTTRTMTNEVAKDKNNNK